MAKQLGTVSEASVCIAYHPIIPIRTSVTIILDRSSSFMSSIIFHL